MNSTKAKIGFGTYRVNSDESEHYSSLKKAVLGGIDLIDTSSNYGNGDSEILIGNLLYDLFSEGKINREDIKIVSKVGYIQGQNYSFALKRKESGKPFSEVCEYSEGLWHCISPEFISDQIERQLTRLHPGKGEKYIDIYLLHNPEYFLGWALNITNSSEPEKIYSEYYRRIKTAFIFLEELTAKGLIKSYGISSNTFVSSSNTYDFTSLENVTEIASEVSSDNHFKYIQFPFNLIESGAMFEKNQKSNSKTLIEFASDKKIKMIVNRPLNVITNQGLLRLDIFESTPFTESEITDQIEFLSLAEDDLFSRIIDRGLFKEDKLKAILVFSTQLRENWKKFYSYQHFKEVMQNYFSPRLNILGDKVGELDEYKKFLKEFGKTISFVSSYYKENANKIVKNIENIVNRYIDDGYLNYSFPAKALLTLKAVSGIDYVLVGAKKESYADEIISVNNDTEFEIDSSVALELIRTELDTIKPAEF